MARFQKQRAVRPVTKVKPAPATAVSEAPEKSEDTYQTEQDFLTPHMLESYPRLPTAQRLSLLDGAGRHYSNRQVNRFVSTLKIMREPVADPVKPVTEPAVKHPENFDTYEDWLKELGKFAQTHQFEAHDGLRKPPPPHDPALDDLLEDIGNAQVMGDSKPASRDKNAPADKRPVDFVNPQVGDHFIDHPTSDWLKANLPPELIYTAYRLPSDCADMAVILRHVWLFYHNRTERYNGMVVGVGAGKTEKQRHDTVANDIAAVTSGTVASMVNAYSKDGKAIRELDKLAPLLHPGDILVWEHRKFSGKKPVRSGGHTQTVTTIERDPASGKIKMIRTLQGNQPIDTDIAAETREQLHQKPYPKGGHDPIRDTPGRRIEIGTIYTAKLHTDADGIWVWDDTDGGKKPPTMLVAAGPPAGAIRPKKVAGGKPTLGTPADWLPGLKKANRENIQGNIEAALQALRAVVEGGQEVDEAIAAQLGEAAGGQLYKLDHQKPPLAGDQHLAQIKNVQQVIDSLAKGVTLDKFKGGVQKAYGTFKESFDRAALRNEITLGPGKKTRRIPVEGLAGGFQPKGKSGAGQAAVIIPPAVKITNGKDQPPVEVMLHFHGYEARMDKGADSHDMTQDKLGEQLEASGRPMVAVMPQGSSKSDFGPDFNADAYINEVFQKLTDSGVWKVAPKISNVVLSAHSGGGFTLTEGGMLGDSSRAPTGLGEVALFDAINGPKEYKALIDWLLPKLDQELKALNDPKNSTEEQKLTFLKTKAFRLKAYHTGNEAAKPDISMNGSYATRYAQLRIDLKQWFTGHAGDLGGEGSKIFEAFRNNYEVKATGGGAHENLMGRGHVQDALSQP